MSAPYIEHQRTEAQGFEVVVSTFNDACHKSGDLIWVGYLGEGRWLTADEAEQLAGAIFGAAAIHRARIASQVAA